MTTPDVTQYNDDPAYLRCLVEASGLFQRQAARAIGHNERTMRYWLAGRHQFPYSVQHTLAELIVRSAVKHAQANDQALPFLEYRIPSQ